MPSNTRGAKRGSKRNTNTTPVRRSVDKGSRNTNKTIRKRNERAAREAAGVGSYDPVAHRLADKEAFEAKQAEIKARQAAKRSVRRDRADYGRKCRTVRTKQRAAVFRASAD